MVQVREREGTRRVLRGSKEVPEWQQGQMAQEREREGPRRVPRVSKEALQWQDSVGEEEGGSKGGSEGGLMMHNGNGKARQHG